MPGCHVTDHQMKLLKKFRQTHSTAVAAAKASISPATAYRIESDPRLPSLEGEPWQRLRFDPLVDIFDTEIVPMLEADSGLRSVAVFEETIRRHFELRTASAGR